MCEKAMRGAATRAVVSMLAACAAALCFATAGVAAPLSQIAITPSSGCGLLTAYTAGTGLPAWSGPTPSCGTGAFTLAFNQGNTPPPAAPPPSHGVESAGGALSQAWRLTGVPNGARMGYQISAPPGITINQVYYDDSQLQNIANGRGWIGFTYWNGGTAPVHTNGTAVDAAAPGPSLDTNLDTTYWGIELRCVQSVCSWPGLIQLDQILVYASEAQGPSITPVADPSSLWAQTGHWIWNAPGNAWSLPIAGADSSGVCTLSLGVGTSTPIADPSLPPPNNASWQECQAASWTPAVDTRDYISGAGQLPVALQATNAAGLSNGPMSETLNVDNDPVSVSLGTPNDPNPTVWVNHAVTVDATPSTGPSGLGGMTCADGGAAQSYPAGGLTVNGDGVRTVSCTAWNNAVDPQGSHNSGTSSVTVHIDEAPPALSLEPVNPNDPTGVVAEVSDSESGVAGGSIEMAPAGTGSWTALPTTFTGSQLVAHFNDAGMRGQYTFSVRSCDSVGNCSSTARTVMLPLRTQAVSEVSLEQLPTTRCGSARPQRDAAAPPARSRHPQVSETRLAGGSALRLAAGGGFLRPHAPSDPELLAPGGVLTAGSSGSVGLSLSHPAQRLSIARATMAQQEKPHKSCGTFAARLTTRASVAFGQPVRLRGLLMSSAGMPIAGQPVAILTAPDNGSNAFAQAAAVTTGPDGSWTATLPPGPSRIIEAAYAGSPTILPATGSATVITPAKIEITRVTPDHTPWDRTVRITGRVLGGYIPASSKLLRLDLGIVGIPGLSKIQGIPNVSPDGTFTTTYKFARYQGVVRFWLQVSSLREADFPFSPARSKRWIVTVGVPTQKRKTRHAHGSLAKRTTSRGRGLHHRDPGHHHRRRR